MNRSIIAALLATAVTSSAAAQASYITDGRAFAVAPLDEGGLAGVRGGASPFALLTVRTFSRIADDNGRADLRQTAGIGRVQMDVWWGSTGSELIAQSVRNGGYQ